MQNNLQQSKPIVAQLILWLILAPQSLLLLLNIRAWNLIAGEAGKGEIFSASVLVLCEVSVLLATLLTYWLYRRAKISIGVPLGVIGLAAHGGYMILFLSSIHSIIPNTIQPWIVNEGGIGQWNITLFMPGAFLCLYVLSKAMFAGVTAKKGIKLTLAILFSTPLAWYLLSVLIQPLWLGQFFLIGWLIFAAVLVILFLAAIIYIFDNLIHKRFSEQDNATYYITAILLGLVAPIAGLALNRSIPFPVDFQSTSVYILTTFNGLILLLKPGDTRFLAGKYFLRCMSFPFTVYFFMVFLPFLPLSLFAILALGAGFLMLTPLALGLFQFQITRQEYQLLGQQQGKTKAIILTVAGLLVIPSYFATEAANDKAALNKVLNYFYAHDFNGQPPTQTEASRAAQALVELRDRKSGIQLPYLAEFYNTIVFGDMVLPNAKIAETYQKLTNEDLPEFKQDVMGRGGRSRPFRNNAIRPNENVKIETIEQSANTPKFQKTVSLTLRNQTDNTHSQYRGTIEVPEGVFITGLRLKIEDQWVNGRIFDKKTALWVFQKITEVRRDPAIIYYTSPNMLELRVYPFPAKGIREVEIDFQFHPKIDAEVKFENSTIDLNPKVTAPALVSLDGTTTIDLSSRGWVRSPYLHVILDYSTGAKLSSNDHIQKINRIGTKLNIDKLKITAANLTSSEYSTALMDLSDAQAQTNFINKIDLIEYGGFWLDRALANELLQLSNHLNDATLNQKPVFVVIQGPNSPIINSVNIHRWRHITPDADTLYLSRGNELTRFSLTSGKRIDTSASLPPVHIAALKTSEKIKLFPAHTSSVVAPFADDQVSIYKPQTHSFASFQPQKTAKNLSPEWSNLAQLWHQWEVTHIQAAKFESERSWFLEQSRQQSLLLPSTSFIVVERDSQWKILEHKEKQSINNHSALEFEDVQQASEPHVWIMLLIVLLLVLWREIGPRTLIKRFY